MSNEYEDYEQDKPKKFQITRGMLILGIIALVIIVIVVVIIVSSINKNKVSKYTTEDFARLENRMVEEAPIYAAQKSLTLTETPIKIDLDVLLERNGGTINQDNIKATKVCTGYVLAVKNEAELYTAYIDCGNYYKTKGYSKEETSTTTKTTTTKDVEKPDLTLNGGDTISVEKDSNFTDPGAKAIDNVDGDITSNIKVSGSVDTSKIGTYTITYEITDAAGNKEKKARKVTVVPKTTTTTTKKTTTKTTTKKANNVVTTTKKVISPVVTTPPKLTIKGNNLVSINAGENYTDAGCTATDATGKDITSKIITKSNVNISVPGTYYVTYEVTDSYGNYSSTRRVVSVKNTNVSVSSISASPNNKTLSPRESYTIQYYISPTNATDKSVTFVSSNNAVATVSSNGTVTARTVGTSIITIKTSNGKTATVTVTVK